MHHASGRRSFLRMLCGTACVSFARAGVAQSHGLTVTPLAPRLRVISGAGGNVVVLDGPTGVLLVNGGAADHSPSLLATVARETGGKGVEVLFNTDWHRHHTGSNEPVGKAGARIVAHVHTKQYLGAELFVDWGSRTYKPLPAAALPTETFHTTGAMTFGGERVEYGHLGQAHTDGDIYVFFRDANVLAVGDVLSVDKYPIADYTTGGWLGGLATASKTLADLANDDTRVVAAAGAVQARTALRVQQEMLAAMRDRLAKMMRQGLSAKDMLAAGVTREFDAKWGDPELFLATSYRGLWLHVRELGGIV
jgi:glyoxylase-like metal-dependent hydrolase (beta-lactamase superfamily II)